MNPAEGDWVEAVVCGKVVSASGKRYLSVRGNWVPLGQCDNFKLIDPPWETGDVVQSGTGQLFQRTASGKWLAFGTSDVIEDYFPARPLKKVHL